MMGWTPSLPRWPLGVTNGWQRSIRRPTRRCCASFPRGAKTWWPSVPGRSIASTGFYGTSCPAGYLERSRSPEPPAFCAAYERRAPRPAFAGGWLRGGAALRIRTLQRKIADLDGRIEDEVEASGSTLTEIFGVGPILAAKIIGAIGNVRRFPSKAHFASYSGTAPVESSSGEVVRHRLSLAGNRRLNNALHMVAICQARSDLRGRAYYRKKLAEGKSRKEALRCLKRRISDAVFKSLMADSLQEPSCSVA
jgi:Transposase IS116/IS110/IS902 family